MKYREIKCLNCETYNRPYLEEGRYWYGCLVCGTKILMRNLKNYNRPDNHDTEYRDYKDNEVKELNNK